MIQQFILGKVSEKRAVVKKLFVYLFWGKASVVEVPGTTVEAGLSKVVVHSQKVFHLN